jgi:crotonobetainyl-CoA:carnitine CoA-transferase CaiB-like acyl-CoA transferase
VEFKEIEAALMSAGVPCACVNNFKEVFDDPHMIERGIVKDVEHPRLGRMRAVRNPILLDHNGPAIERCAPMLGEHSEEILRQLGYSPDAIAQFIAAGVTRNAPRSAPQAAE